MPKVELFCLPSPYAVRITHENGRVEFAFYPTRKRAEMEVRVMTGEEPDINLNFSELFPKHKAKVVRK